MSKAWYDNVDNITLQRVRTYSAFNDGESKNLMLQTVYEYRERELQDFKTTNHELALESIAKGKEIRKLEKENAELKRDKEQITKAKAIIKDYMIVATSGHTTVCSVPEENRCINVLKLNERAEQFLEEISE